MQICFRHQSNQSQQKFRKKKKLIITIQNKQTGNRRGRRECLYSESDPSRHGRERRDQRKASFLRVLIEIGSALRADNVFGVIYSGPFAEAYRRNCISLAAIITTANIITTHLHHDEPIKAERVHGFWDTPCGLAQYKKWPRKGNQMTSE